MIPLSYSWQNDRRTFKPSACLVIVKSSRLRLRSPWRSSYQETIRPLRSCWECLCWWCWGLPRLGVVATVGSCDGFYRQIEGVNVEDVAVVTR